MLHKSPLNNAFDVVMFDVLLDSEGKSGPVCLTF